MPEYGILAAYDGSAYGYDALRWAVREAKARQLRLTVFLASDLAPPGQPPAHDVVRLAADRGDHLLADGLSYAESAVGTPWLGLEVTGEPPAQALCERSRDAEMTVLGARGRSSLPGMTLGSVPWHVAAHGRGPIVVVRGRWTPVNTAAGPVVVGVDGSPASQDAVTLAFEEATLRQAPLTAVCALADAPSVVGKAHLMEEAFDHEMTRREKDHPDVKVMRHVVHGSPRESLLTAAADAQLVVIGARGRGGFKDLVLGSVPEALIHYSPCPVAVLQRR